MTYLKTALIASALTAAASSEAYAGDKNYNGNKVMQKTTVTTSARTPSVMGVTASSTATKANDTIGEVLQADGQPDTQSDYELLTHDGDMLTKSEAKMMDSDNSIANNAIVVPSSSGALTTVNCPIGTTAKPDMTCHVTGNYDLERSENLRKQEIMSDTKVMGVVNTDADTKMKASDWSDADMDSKNWETQNWDRSDAPARYQLDTEYKGTLRPDTVVTDNVD